MTARRRLDRDDAIEAVARLETFAAGRTALAGRLHRLGLFLSRMPSDASEFPLLPAAQAVDPDDAEPVAAFREFRRTLARFAADRGMDLALVVDGQKRAADSARVWWVEGTDATDRKLSELSAASTAAVLDSPVIPSLGRSERDGKTVVRTFFDVAPADASKVGRAVKSLLTRLASDREYLFEQIPSPKLGDDVAQIRIDALASADLVVVFLSPEYLRWSTEGARRMGPAIAAARGRVAPVCWSRLTDRNDLGQYGLTRIFGVDASGAGGNGPPAEMLGLDRLSQGRLDDEMADLHTRLIEVLASPRADRMVELARFLAASDEPHPITARALRTQLDKGVGEAASQSGPAVDVVEHLVTWATSTNDRPYFVVFGEYGMGKTIATQTLTRELLSRRETDPSVPLPIYFDLRLLGTDVRKRDATLDELLADLIKRAWRTGRAQAAVTPDDVITAVQHRRAVVIFDGLDEVLVHMSEQQGQGLLRELLRILPPQLATGSGTRRDAGKVVLTCRTHFFRTIRDQHTFFRAQDRDGVGADLYEALHLLPFDDQQVRAYLAGKQGLGGVDKAVELIRSVHDLEGLASRPYNLRLISEQLERLERRVAEGGSIDAAGLYDELVQSWLERDMGKHQLERDHKVRLMEDLAALIWSRHSRQIGAGDLEEWLRARLLEDDDLGRWVQLRRPDPAVLAEDLRTATFIVRPGSDQFEFAHTSLLEYFLARYLHRTMRAGHAEAWRVPAVSHETLDFLVEIAASHDDEGFTRHLLACGGTYQERVSEHVVRYALRASEQDRPALSLQGFHLATADLRGLRAAPPPGADVDMTHCVLTGADLRDAMLQQVRLDGADLSGARLTRAELHRCSLRGADLTGAQLDGAILRSTSLHGARLHGASGDDSQWLWCEGEPEGEVAGRLVAPAASMTSPSPTLRLEVLAGPCGEISSLAWSPDGARLAGADGASVIIWNPGTGAQHASMGGHTGGVRALAWSPDGSRLAGGDGDGVVRLWDPADPDAPPLALTGDTGWVQALAWSPDGSRLASGGDGDVVRLWDPADPDAPPLALTGDTGWVQALAWSPDGCRLAGGGGGGVVWLWDPADPDASPLALTGDAGWVWGLAWSPDGCRLAVGGDGDVVWLWDPADPDAPPLTLTGDAGSVGALAWSPDGSRLAGSGDDGVVRLWDPADPDAPPLALTGDTGSVRALAWSPDGSRLAGGGGGGVRLWDPADPDAPPLILTGHPGLVRALAWSPDGSRLAVGGRDVVRVWDPADPDAPPLTRTGAGWVQALAWSPDGARLASGGYDNVVRLWDPADPDAPPLALTGHTGWVQALAWSPDGSRLAGSGGYVVRLWDPADPDAPPRALTGHTDWVQALAWSPDGSRLAGGGHADVVRLWDPADPDAPPLTLTTGFVETLAWSPDGSRLAEGGYDDAVRLWDPADPDAPPRALPGHTRSVRALAWSPDGSRLAGGGDDGVVRLWDPADPDAPPRALPGHTRSVRALAWSPDGSRLAAGGGDDGVVRLWDVRHGGQVVLTLQLFSDGAWCTIGADGRIRGCSGEVWRWLRWRSRDPVSGRSTLLPAEYFGPLPDVTRPD